ncbi:MAG: hypothetical protein WD187_00755 [Candidatus Woykebacteria bacterium]
MADLNKVIKILKENGVKDDDARTFIINLNNLLSQKLYLEVATALNDEKEMSRLNSLPPEEMKVEIAKLYKQKTDKDVAAVSDEMLDSFVTGFLTQYHQQRLSSKKS